MCRLCVSGRKHSEIEIRMSDELDADDSVCALWIRNGSFKYDSDPTSSADSPKGTAAAATGKTQADKQKLLATDEARSR